MHYLKVKTLGDKTVLDFYFELHDDYMEQRKIEIANGTILGFACKEFSFRGTHLAKTPLLSMEELVKLSDTEVSIIDRETFESLWNEVNTVVGKVNKE